MDPPASSEESSSGALPKGAMPTMNNGSNKTSRFCWKSRFHEKSKFRMNFSAVFVSMKKVEHEAKIKFTRGHRLSPKGPEEVGKRNTLSWTRMGSSRIDSRASASNARLDKAYSPEQISAPAEWLQA